MPFVSDAVSTSTSAIVGYATEVANCVYDGFRGDFAGAAACLRESGLHRLLTDAWQGARQRYERQGAGVPGVADVAFACALSALTIGATCRYLWPELRALENALGAGEDERRQWANDTRELLLRRTPEDVTAMRQCLTAFDATQASAHPLPSSAASGHASASSRRKLAEHLIAEALVLHIADTPQICVAQSDRIAMLCQLLAHGLGFKLPQAAHRALNLDEGRASLVRYDGAFALLRERLEPDWQNDIAGSPTFSVHPVDVQLFDPAETTDELSEETQDVRRMLTHPDALRRVRSRVVALIAASVHEDCGSGVDWRDIATMALGVAVQRGLTCERVHFAMGLAIRSEVSARFAWRWSDEPVAQPGQAVTPTIPMDVAQWVSRVLLVAGMPERRTPCPPRLAALARGDTPPALVIGATDWMHLVDGIRALGRDHWRASYAQVCEAGRS